MIKGKKWIAREVNGEVIVEEKENNNMFSKIKEKMKEMIDKKQIEYERRQRRENWLKGNYNEAVYDVSSADVIDVIKLNEGILGFGVDEVIVDTTNKLLTLRWGVL